MLCLQREIRLSDDGLYHLFLAAKTKSQYNKHEFRSKLTVWAVWAAMLLRNQS